jgi:hypothetical protein
VAHIKIVSTGLRVKDVNIIYVSKDGEETDISDVISYFEIRGAAQNITECELGLIKVIPEFDKVALQDIFVTEGDDPITK